MSNLMFRQKMITALEAMQKSCSDMCDILKDEAGRNMELPQSDTEVAHARRMWKRWGYINDEGGNAGTAFYEFCHKKHHRPVTILPGHSAVEEIEREAYTRGWDAAALLLDGNSPDLAIDGVEPVVVDGFTWSNADKPWLRLLGYQEVLDVSRVKFNLRSDKGDHAPCRVHLYVGIGPNGKRVQP